VFRVIASGRIIFAWRRAFDVVRKVRASRFTAGKRAWNSLRWKLSFDGRLVDD
jgi:hypothetical protein